MDFSRFFEVKELEGRGNATNLQILLTFRSWHGGQRKHQEGRHCIPGPAIVIHRHLEVAEGRYPRYFSLFIFQEYCANCFADLGAPHIKEVTKSCQKCYDVRYCCERCSVCNSGAHTDDVCATLKSLKAFLGQYPLFDFRISTLS